MKKITKETYMQWYEDMLFWRKFEDKLAAVYIQQKVRGFLHLYNGQEAVLAGSLHAMDLSKDKMITAYRNHVQPIGMGVDPKKVQPQLTAGARRAGVTHSLRHFRKADATRVKVQTMRIGHHGPFSRSDLNLIRYEYLYGFNHDFSRNH